jgi:hypothetical protein
MMYLAILSSLLAAFLAASIAWFRAHRAAIEAERREVRDICAAFELRRSKFEPEHGAGMRGRK